MIYFVDDLLELASGYLNSLDILRKLSYEVFLIVSIEIVNFFINADCFSALCLSESLLLEINQQAK